MSTLNKIENAKVELTCTIEGETWKTAQKNAFNKLAQKVEIKGFRKGKAPQHLVKQAISQPEIFNEALQAVANGALNDAIAEHNIELIDMAELSKVNKVDEESVEMVFTCPVKPDVKLGQYKGLGYHVEDFTVSDEEVNKEIDRIRDERADLELKDEDGIVDNGDTVVIDFEGFKDGVPFEGGKAENHELVIGSGSFIPGFEEQLIGMKAEEQREINVTFPEDYHSEELKGAAAVFKVTVHEIKVRVLPELDDELVTELNIENVKTVEEFKTFLKERMTERRESENTNKANEELLNKVCENTEIEIPEVMIQRELDYMVKDYANKLSYQGITLEMYFKYTNSNEEALKKVLRPQAESTVKRQLILEEVAKIEKVEVSKEEIETEFANMAKAYERTVEEIKQVVNATDLETNLRLNKALDVMKA